MANVSASSPINPHFLQPLLPGFHSHINIPIAFYSKHIEGTTNDSNANATVKLRSDASDVTWEVKMDGRRLTQGWEKFATGHAFKVGDIVIFRHDGDLLFHVTFWPSCCEIQYNDDDSDSEKYQQQHTRETGSSSDNSCLVARVTESNLINDALFLPGHFSRSNGFVNRECEIILMNEDGKPWTLFLKYYDTSGHVYIRRGWRSFCQANRKRAKDVLTFKLVKTGTKPVLQFRAYSVYNRRSSSSSSISQDRFVTLTLRPYNLKNSKLVSIHQSFLTFYQSCFTVLVCIWQCLPVPFVKANGIKNAREITLVDRYGVKRTTSLKPDDKYGRMRLGKECIKFCEVKSL
ncbi:unnamed protein product [Brassica oleracea]|uniref:(rape) hypothetical protein n=1 Tax=Brassica napus TaxID=3708 RepID=A0A816I9M0_BRANA|nr:unnamed protein product [Brassica napus]